MPLNLRTHDPQDRVDDSNPLELLAAAQALEAWDEDTLSVADYLLNAWTVRACMNGDSADISDLETVLRALLERLPTSPSLPLITRGRWQGYHDLIAGRALCQPLNQPSNKKTDPILDRTHVRDILALLPINGGFVEQSNLNLAGKLSPSRLSQILGSMADHGLIQFRRNGKCKEWRLTEGAGSKQEELPETAACRPGGFAGLAFGQGTAANDPQLLAAVEEIEQERKAA